MLDQLNNPESLAFKTLKIALEEDIGSGDITSNLTIPDDINAKMYFVSREDMVVCGIDIIQKLAAIIDKNLHLEMLVKDGDFLNKGTCIVSMYGNARSGLSVERVALNFIQKLSGVATLSRQYSDAVKNTNVKIFDTRKTTPALRVFEKYAVKIGGCFNHRMGLYDAILIKDNHIAIAGGLSQAIQTVKNNNVDNLTIEVECDTLSQVEEALSTNIDIILLDNMDISALKTAVELNKKYGSKTKLEASGGITLRNVADVANTGVDYISVGALTHSAPSIDIGLDFEYNNSRIYKQLAQHKTT